MPLPLTVILKTLTTLGSAIGLYVTRQKKEEIEGKRDDAGKTISALQADVQKQTAFMASLTKEVEALAVQVQKHQVVQDRLTVAVFVVLALSLLLTLAVIWMELDR